MTIQHEEMEEMSEFSQTLTKLSRDHRIAMTEFNDAAKRREQFSLRAERRMNYWLRLSMGGLFILMILVVFLLFVLMQHTHNISEQMKMMNQHLSASQATSVIDNSPTLKAIESELQNLNNNMTKVASDLKAIAQKSNDSSSTYTYPYGYPYRH
jgi:flagellar biosynthesis/type III secretory pathway M-ring protein FliF/YscJ